MEDQNLKNKIKEIAKKLVGNWVYNEFLSTHFHVLSCENKKFIYFHDVKNKYKCSLFILSATENKNDFYSSINVDLKNRSVISIYKDINKRILSDNNIDLKIKANLENRIKEKKEKEIKIAFNHCISKFGDLHSSNFGYSAVKLKKMMVYFQPSNNGYLKMEGHLTNDNFLKVLAFLKELENSDENNA